LLHHKSSCNIEIGRLIVKTTNYSIVSIELLLVSYNVNLRGRSVLKVPGMWKRVQPIIKVINSLP